MNQLRLPMQLYYAWPNEKLQAYLTSQVHGNDEIIQSPFAEHESPEEMTMSWNRVLENLASEWPSLYEYEMEQLAKVGPQSGQIPLSERLPDINEYYTAGNVKGEPLAAEALDASMTFWRSVVGVRRRSRDNTIAAMKKSTNSGSPFFTVKRNVVAEEYNATYVVRGDQWLTTYPNKGTYRACATLGWKGDMGGPTLDDVKQRVLWMFPFNVNVAELSYYQPLIKQMQVSGVMPPWLGTEAVNNAMTQLIRTKGERTPMICTDFKAFDQHFNHAMQECALTLLERLFTRDSSEELHEVLGYKYKIPLCIKDSTFLFGHHGMSSGSGGTNGDESLAHKALQFEAAIRNKSVLNRHSMCLGDDGILSYPGIHVDAVVESYTRHGLAMQASKQHVSTEDAIFLRLWYHRDYTVDDRNVGVYPTMRALGKLRFPRRSTKSWTRKTLAMRALSIIENCRYHPYFEDFVTFCVTRDKYRLGLDIPMFMEHLDEEFLLQQAAGTLDVSYNQEAYDQRPPSTWSVVKILKTLK